jgi:branched-chain amino acid transport system ATP-binding protein
VTASGSGLLLSSATVLRSGFPIVRDVSLLAPYGEITVLLGPNGAGRTTLLEAISGILPLQSGDVALAGASIKAMSRVARHHAGIAHVEQGRAVFTTLTVEENLLVSCRAGRTSKAYDWFPELVKRRNTKAAELSGGEQQMLVIARALLGRPHFLMVDELSLGLAPLIVQRLLVVLRELASQGVGVLLVEQYAELALGVGQSAYVMNHGTVVLQAKCAELLSMPEKLHAAYLL